MRLDRVTITGADDSVTPEQLYELSRDFPFVEWALLFSPKQQGKPRWPSISWMRELSDYVISSGLRSSMRFSSHLCGEYVRKILAGDYLYSDELSKAMFLSERVQLNFHAEPHSRFVRRPNFEFRLAAIYSHIQVIFQIDGVNDEIFQDIYGDVKGDFVPLFDCSHGAGVVPKSWPKAEYIYHVPDENGNAREIPIYHGYAGGLGPDTLENELPRIAEAAGDAPVWVDMETRVRSAADRQFDLAKVRRCLEICKPFITKQP